MKIIVDAMGGDNAPQAPVRGALDAIAEYGVEVVLVGRGEDILEALHQEGISQLPAGLEILRAGPVSEAHVTLREGKFHQIKRMLAQRGKPVLYLERVRMGPLGLDPALARGEFRHLTVRERENLGEI